MGRRAAIAGVCVVFALLVAAWLWGLGPFRARSVARDVADGGLAVPTAGARTESDPAPSGAPDRRDPPIVSEPSGVDASSPLRGEDATGAPGVGSIRLRVVDAGLRPIAGAQVSMDIDPGAPPEVLRRVRERTPPTLSWRGATTGPDGTARVIGETTGPGDVVIGTLFVRAQGMALRTLERVECRAGAERDLGDVALGPGRAIAGRVVDEAGQPVPAAAVWEWRESAAWSDPQLGMGGVVPPLDSVTTGADGRFTLAAVREGWTRIRAVREGYVPAVVQGEIASDASITLVAGTPLRGRVVRAGQPVAGAIVLLARDWSTAFGDRAIADAEGWFRHPGLAPGTVFVSACAADGSAQAFPALEMPPPSQPIEIELPADVPAAVEGQPGIRGVVVDAGTGAPVPFPSVIAFRRPPADASERGDPAGETRWSAPEAGGRFALPFLYGTLDLWVRARGYAEAHLEAVATPNVHGPEVTVRLERAGAAIRGRVRDLGGRPIPGARVSMVRRFPGWRGRPRDDPIAHFAPAETDADGRFEIGFLGREPVRLRIALAALGFVDQTVGPVDPGREPLDIECQPAATIRGRLLLGAEPVPWWEILVAREGTPLKSSGRADELERDEYRSADPTLPRVVRTDAEGAFVAAGLPPGRWVVASAHKADLRIGSGGHERLVLATLDLAAGETRTLELVQALPGRLEGRVHAPGPLDPRGSWVEIRPRGGIRPQCCFSIDRDGRFESGPLPPGRYDVVARGGEGYALDGCAGPVEVRSGETASLDVALPTGRLRARVAWADGSPLTGERLAILRRVGDPAEPSADLWIKDGLLDVGAVPPGRYVLEVRPTPHFGGDAPPPDGRVGTTDPFDHDGSSVERPLAVRP